MQNHIGEYEGRKSDEIVPYVQLGISFVMGVPKANCLRKSSIAWIAYLDARKVLEEGGHFVSTEPSVKGLLMTILTWPLSKSGQIMLAVPSADDLRELIRLYEVGKLKVVIDSTFSFEQAAQAHHRVESGVDHGKVVLINEHFLD